MDIQLDRAPCGYFSILDSGIVQSVNQTFLDMLQIERDQLIGCHIESTMSVTNKLFFHTYFSPYIQLYGRVDEMYFSFRRSDQQDVPVLLNGIRQRRDGIDYIDCVAVKMTKRIQYERDIIETKTKLQELYQATNEANKQLELLHEEYEMKQQELLQLNGQLEALAFTDPLTSLKNRRFFQTSLQTMIAVFQETEQPLSLLIMDIDHFKKINDTYGHPVGDSVLVNLAELLQSTAREFDIVARYGGEEFVILLPNTDQAQSVMIAEQYRLSVASKVWGEYAVTISIGAATASPQDNDQSLLHLADTALYASKAGGRNRVTHAG